jgi:hypothetical protein
MGTGDQSGTWGVTTNTNLGTLLEQAITGYQAIAKVGTGDYTLSNTDYAVNENRNAIIEFTGTPGGAFNVVVPNAEKLWVFKNSTNGAMTIKTSGGVTTVTVATSTSRWVFCDGAGAIYDVLTGTLATQTASNVAITGGTITGLTSLTLASGAATPATNDAAALGTTSLMWSDLFLASGAVINFNNGDVTITHSANALAFAGASSGYTFDALVSPASNDGAALGTGTVSWSDLFLASGGVINFANGDVLVTHSSNTLAFTGASSGYTFDANVATTGTFTKNGNDVTVGTVTYVIDGGGSTITTGSKGFLQIPFACTVNNWTIVADQSGSIVVDVKRSTYSGFPTTSSIAGSEKPTLSSVQKNQDLSLSTWTTSIAAGDILEFNVDSVTTVQRVTLALQVTRA